MNTDIKYGAQNMNQKIKMILRWPNIIEVWDGDKLIYSGTDWKSAQLAVVPF